MTDFLEEVRSRVDIREVVSEYVALRKSGNRYRGLCPFHSEKTPSFHVDAGKQLFYCFGCGAGGDVFKFLMLSEKVDFGEALRMLARRYGVPIPRRETPRSSEREELLGIHRAAHLFFRGALRKERDGAPGREYLGRRGITHETAEAFGVGFAPDSWDALKKKLTASGLAEGRLLAAGLLARHEESGRTYDRFRNRVIFPIFTPGGEVIGFGGRIVGEGEPKYLNSPETALFRKGENLYGLHRTAEAIRKRDTAVLVEGYLDFLSLYQAGFGNLAAILGTGFTPSHARLLGRLTRKVVVSFDPDPAGQAAAARSLEHLLEAGFEVRILALPGGKDPDRFVREDGPEAYRRLLDGAPPCIEYLARWAAGRVDIESTAGKIEALNLVLPYVARLESAVERSEQVKLLSELLRIEDGVVLQELRSAIRTRKTNLKSAPGPVPAGPPGAAARLVRILLEDGEARRSLMPRIRDADFGGSEVERIWEAIRSLVQTGSEPTFPRVGSMLEDAPGQDLLLRIASAPGPGPSLAEGERCLRKLRESSLARRLQDLQDRLEKAGPGVPVDDLIRQKIDLRKEMRALKTAPAP